MLILFLFSLYIFLKKMRLIDMSSLMKPTPTFFCYPRTLHLCGTLMLVLFCWLLLRLLLRKYFGRLKRLLDQC